MCLKVKAASLAAIDTNGAKDEGGKQTCVPDEHQGPERVVTGRALGPRRQVGVHRGEEGLGQARATSQRNGRWQGRRNDPADHGQHNNDGVDLKGGVLRDLEPMQPDRAEKREQMGGDGQGSRSHEVSIQGSLEKTMSEPQQHS